MQGEVRELQIQLVKMLGLEMMEMCFVASATLRKKFLWSPNNCQFKSVPSRI